MEHEIILESELDTPFPWEDLLKTCITQALSAQGVEAACEVDVLITDDAGIQEINRDQRGIDRPTDVLSFPMFQFTPGAFPPAEELETDPETGLLPLGDMVISYQRCLDQAAEYGHSPERELGYLCVHSLLHLLGYDHMDGDDGPMKRQMRQREEAILSALSLERTE